MLRFGAKIAGELLKSVPCEGAVSRELLELELGELKRDRDILEDKLTLLLSSATLPGVRCAVCFVGWCCVLY